MYCDIYIVDVLYTFAPKRSRYLIVNGVSCLLKQFFHLDQDMVNLILREAVGNTFRAFEIKRVIAISKTDRGYLVFALN